MDHARRVEHDSLDEGRGHAFPVSRELVGRVEEFGRLLEALTRRPAVVLIEGEAGVGKTRLVEELLQAPALRGDRVLVGQCVSLREPFPLGPLIGSLRGCAPDLRGVRLSPVAGALSEILPELADVLPVFPAALEEPGHERHLVFRGLVEVLRALSPAVVVMEDVHWADAATFDFLRFLVAERLAQTAVVLTARGEELLDPSVLLGVVERPPLGLVAERVQLRPLDPDEVRGLVGSLLGADDVSDEFAAYLHARTGGLPLAVEEVLRLMRERHDLVRWEGRWARRALDRLGVPAAVRGAVIERLGRLSDPARSVVEAAAVLTRPASERMLARVAATPAGDVRAGLVEALHAALLVETGPGLYGFRHQLAQEVAYDSLSTPERRGLHERAAAELRTLDAGAHAHLAHHLRGAGLLEEWPREAEAAADRASAVGDAGEAARFLIEILREGGRAPADRARIALKLGHAALHGVAHEDAIELLGPVCDQPDIAPAQRGELRLALGHLLRQSGDASASQAQLAAALADLADRPVLYAGALRVLANPWVVEDTAKDHLGWLEQAAEIAAPHDAPELTAAIRVDEAALRLALGDPEGWAAVKRIERDESSHEGQRQWIRANMNLGVACAFLGHYEQTDAFLAEGERAAKEHGHPRFVGAMEGTHLLIEWNTGRWHDLEQRAKRLADLTSDVRYASLDAQLVLGMLRIARGYPEEGERLLRAVCEDARRAGSIPQLAAATGTVARVRLAAGDASRAVAITRAATEVLAHKAIWAWSGQVTPVAVQALLASDAADEARALVKRLTRGLRGKDAPAAHAALLMCRASLAAVDDEPPAATRLLARAARQWDALPEPYTAAQAREQAGVLLLSHGDETGAEPLLGALAAFHDLGARWDAQRVRRVLKAHDVTVGYPWRGGPRSYGDALTPREREVARLASLGNTNREIAEALFVSPRTVEKQVAAIVRKLDLPSKRALTPELLDRLLREQDA